MVGELVPSLARYLDAQLTELTFDESGQAGNLFMGDIPQTPDLAVALRTSGGPEPDSKLGYDTVHVQARVRGDQDPRTSANLAQKVYEALLGVAGVTLPQGPLVVLITTLGPPSDMGGTDSEGRYEYVVNLVIEVRNVAGNRV